MAALFFPGPGQNSLKADEGGQPTQIRQTSLGPIKGLSSPKGEAYLGIPYAKAPTGELRFAPPVSPEPWTEPYPAVKYGPLAHQVFPGGISSAPAHEGYSLSEDCLNLNVFLPPGTKPGAGLPVFVFIHGGGFAIGAGSQPLYDGYELASQGLAVVTINYRLGALGFLASEETLETYGTTGNWGLLDQIKALEWVRDNIEAFGGDPAKVTIGGESAGSFSVSSLIVSPMAKGLFRGAIMESGTVLSLSRWPYGRGDLENSIALGRILGQLLDVPEDSPEGLSKLRQARAQDITALSEIDFDFSASKALTLIPVRDGKVIPLDPQKAMAEGQASPVNLLIGFNRDEGTLFLPQGKDRDTLDWVMLTFLGEKAGKAFRQRFPEDRDNPYLDRVREALAYVLFSAGSKRFADIHSRFGDVYMYRFDYVSPQAKAMGLAAHHAAELPFVFGNFKDFGYPDKPKGDLANGLMVRWANFVKTGNPNQGAALPTPVSWPKYDAQDPRVLILDESLRAAALPGAEDLDFMADSLFGPLP
jgi:para-nitrobenzyl esterase